MKRIKTVIHRDGIAWYAYDGDKLIAQGIEKTPTDARVKAEAALTK